MGPRPDSLPAPVRSQSSSQVHRHEGIEVHISFKADFIGFLRGWLPHHEVSLSGICVEVLDSQLEGGASIIGIKPVVLTVGRAVRHGQAVVVGVTSVDVEIVP